MQDKSTISKIVYIVLVAVLALAAVFGYDIGVIQPREVARDMLIDPEAQSSRAAGVNIRTEKALVVENYITDKGTLAVTGDTTIGGALAVTGAVTAASFTPQSLATAGNIAANTGTFTTSLITPGTLRAATTVITTSLTANGTSVFAGLTSNGGITATGGITTTTARATGAVSIEGNTAITGTLDVGSTLNFGTDNLYPVGYATTGYQLECGTTATFTGTQIVYTTGLTAVTFALVTQTTDEAATAATLTAATPVTSTFTIKSWKADGATAGDTGVVANWCAVGTQ